MGISYANDEALGMSLAVVEGLVTPDDWIAHVHRQIADPDWPTGTMLLTDARRALPGDYAPGEIDEITALYAAKKNRMRRLRIAIVASSTFAQAREFEEAFEPHGSRPIVFNDLAGEACAWLGVQRSEVETLIEKVRSAMRTAPGA